MFSSKRRAATDIETVQPHHRRLGSARISSTRHCSLRSTPHINRRRQAVACPRAAPKSETYRPPAALVPSAGTITPRINLRQCVCHEHPPLLYLRVVLAARVALIERQEAMQIPSILQAPSSTRLLQGITLGAAATMVIGFYTTAHAAEMRSTNDARRRRTGIAE
jgi:hypothetical protein